MKMKCYLCLINMTVIHDLFGDMKAKTKVLEDVTVPDDSLFEILDEV